MRTLTFHGPGTRLRLPSGRTVDRGQSGEVTDADAKAAERSKRIEVTVHDDAKLEKQRRKRHDKQRTPTGDKSETDTEPEADGEGHTDQQETD